jgi:IPT/TIG domain-containing protein
MRRAAWGFVCTCCGSFFERSKTRLRRFRRGSFASEDFASALRPADDSRSSKPGPKNPRVCVQSLILFSSLLFCARGIHAATQVQQASNSDASGATHTSFTAAFPVATTGGNAILVGVTYGNTNPIITATDSQGNTYAQAIKTYDSGNRQGCAILYATNITGGASSKVTVKFSSSVAYLAVGIHEYSGIATSSALDATSGKIGNGSGLSSGPATTTASGDLVFGCGVEDSIGHDDTFTAGSGFTKRVDLGSAAAYADEDQSQTSAGSIAVTWTLGASSSSIATMAAFKTSSLGAGGSSVGPGISSLSPSSGPVGTSVTITGTNFGATQGTSTLSFNGTAAIPTNWSATSIVAPVPNGATTGNVTAVVGGLASNGVSFSVSQITVAVTPTTASLQVGQSAVFTASLQNDTLNKGVSWSLSSTGCSGSACGTLVQNTLTSATYTAPASVPPSPVTLAATSIADPTKSASATITISPSPNATVPPAVPTFALNHVSASNTQGNPVSSYALRLPNGTQSANCIIVAFQYSATPGVTASVSDDKGNTYSTPISNSDGNQVVNLSFALNVAAGTRRITISFSGGTPAYVSGMASEFYNVATSLAFDGSSGNSGTGSSVTSGSFTPTTRGDLIYQFAVQDSTSNPMISWTQGGSPWLLLSADVMDGSVAQYQVQGWSAPVDPALSMAPSQNFNSVAVALKPASAGNAPPPGIRVVRVQHNSIPAYASNPVRLQFPSTGNLIVAAWIGVPGHDVTTITDGNGNTYTSTGAPFGYGLSGDNQIFYAAAAKTGTTMTGPIFTATGSDISGSTLELFDVAGAATAPFDATAGLATASGTQSSFGSVTGAILTPTTANGLVISSIGISSNTMNGVSPGNFLSAVPAPVASPNPVNQNNGWGFHYNTDTSPETFFWTTQGGAVDDWASIAAAFKAPSGGGTTP